MTSTMIPLETILYLPLGLIPILALLIIYFFRLKWKQTKSEMVQLINETNIEHLERMQKERRE